METFQSPRVDGAMSLDLTATATDEKEQPSLATRSLALS
jgi:hypothetical protein